MQKIFRSDMVFWKIIRVFNFSFQFGNLVIPSGKEIPCLSSPWIHAFILGPDLWKVWPDTIARVSPSVPSNSIPLHKSWRTHKRDLSLRKVCFPLMNEWSTSPSSPHCQQTIRTTWSGETLNLKSSRSLPGATTWSLTQAKPCLFNFSSSHTAERNHEKRKTHFFAWNSSHKPHLPEDFQDQMGQLPRKHSAWTTENLSLQSWISYYH